MSLSLDIGPRSITAGIDHQTLVRQLLGPTEDDMDLLKEFTQNPWRVYTDPTMKAYCLITGSTFSYGPTFPSSVTDTGHGFNTIRLHGEEIPVSFKRPGYVQSVQAWRYRKIYGAWINCRNLTFGASRPSATQFVGIGQGYPTGAIAEIPGAPGTYQLAPPPWPDPPEADFIHLRIRGDLLRWELVVGAAGGVTTTVPLVGTEAPVQSIGQIAHFEWTPAPNPRVRAYINGVLGAEITNPALLPGAAVDYTPCKPYNNWFCCGGNPTGGPTGYVSGDIGPLFMQEFGVKDAV